MSAQTPNSDPITDPHKLPGADPKTGERALDPLLEPGQEIDPVTGHVTTGHDWNGIKELNTPFPRIAAFAMLAAFIYSVITWILLPAWPIGNTYTKGILGADTVADARAEFARISAARADWREQFASDDLEALAADPELMLLARPEMERLFADNCAACHGAQGQGKDGHGGIGFPALDTGHWLWSGEMEDIAEVIRVGINSPDHDETNYAEMLAYGRDQMLERDEIDLLVPWVASLQTGEADMESAAAELFEENCASCHGDGGEGGMEVGAPPLADASWIYGGSEADIRRTLMWGRQGVMPSWEGRLSEIERHMLAIHVAGLSERAGEEAQ